MVSESRRNGLDRRNQTNGAFENNRKRTERRAMFDYITKIIDFVKDIPIFKGLNSEQIQKVLNICSIKSYPKGHFVCQEGEESNEMYIFIDGELKVVKGDTFLAYIAPYGLVGEIGVFTGRRRTASVVNTTNSTVIKINKNELFQLLKSDSDLNNCILLNVIDDLAKKLNKDNELIENLRNYKLPTMI